MRMDANESAFPLRLFKNEAFQEVTKSFPDTLINNGSQIERSLQISQTIQTTQDHGEDAARIGRQMQIKHEPHEDFSSTYIDRFVIDLNHPKIEIESVEDESSNASTVSSGLPHHFGISDGSKVSQATNAENKSDSDVDIETVPDTSFVHSIQLSSSTNQNNIQTMDTFPSDDSIVDGIPRGNTRRKHPRKTPHVSFTYQNHVQTMDTFPSDDSIVDGMPRGNTRRKHPRKTPHVSFTYQNHIQTMDTFPSDDSIVDGIPRGNTRRKHPRKTPHVSFTYQNHVQTMDTIPSDDSIVDGMPRGNTRRKHPRKTPHVTRRDDPYYLYSHFLEKTTFEFHNYSKLLSSQHGGLQLSTPRHPDRKTHHTISERVRRYEINELFLELRRLIPGIEDSKFTKISTLLHAKTYIKEFENFLETQDNIIDSESNKNRILRDMLQKMQLQSYPTVRLKRL